MGTAENLFNEQLPANIVVDETLLAMHQQQQRVVAGLNLEQEPFRSLSKK